MSVVDDIMNAFIDVEFQSELQRKRIEIEKILKEYIKKLSGKKVSKEINSRIKSGESLREKLERKDYINQWGIENSNNKEIQQIICEKLPDLIGFRMNCYFKEDEKNIFEKLKKHLQEMDGIEIEEFPNTKQKNGHEIYKITCKYKKHDKNFSFEVQVKSLLNDVWGEVEHSTIYKSRVYDSRKNLKTDMMEGLYHILSGADTQLNRLYSFDVELKEIDSGKYNSIKNYELSVVILEKPSEVLEVDTFITINKTSRKVDTSLAYVLKNKINKNSTSSSDLTIAKKEFLAVELVIKLNDDKNSLWYKRILFEGNPTNKSYETISLNSFVKSVQMLINYLNKYNIIIIDWQNNQELEKIIDNIKCIYLKIWDAVKFKWPNLFKEESINNSVIQGTIGVSAINKYIILQLKNQNNNYNLEEFISKVEYWIVNINISQDEWYKGNRFSQFSSAAGFNIVANILLDSFEK